MKTKLLRISVFLSLTFSVVSLRAQLAAGDIMFTGVNVDIDDAISFVALAEIPANTVIRFTDNEWQTGSSAFNTGEGFFSWTHTSAVAPGTLIHITALTSGATVNIGAITAGTGSFDLSSSNEVVYAYLGAELTPTTVLCALGNDGFAANGEITGTGLTEGVNAIAIAGDEDIMEYAGARNNQTTWAAYKALIANPANWITEDGAGDQSTNGSAPDVPFNSIAFTLVTPPAEGDILFTAFNADGADGMAFVALKDMPANTEIWFSDNEWNGNSITSGLGAFNDTAEGNFMWKDTVMLPAGTVITFSNYTTSGMLPSQGTVTAGAIPNEGISGSGEVIYAYLGTEGAPTVFLSAITNGTFASNGTIDSTGLVIGISAFELTSGTDIAEYTGARLGQSLFADYKPMILNLSNWASQDASGDQSADGIAPDMPFNATPFDTGTADVIPPIAQSMNIVHGNLSYVVFNELLDSASALDTANYAFSPAVTFDSAYFNVSRDTVFLAHSTLLDGVGYTVSLDSVADTSANIMASAASFNLVWNASLPSLVITEIIHSPNTIEMIEVYNSGATSVNLGGLIWTDGTTGSFPAMTLAPDSVILFSTDPASASSLMGGTYNLLNNGLGSSSDILVIRNSLGQVVDSVEYLTASPWPAATVGVYGNSIELISDTLDNNIGSNWTVPTHLITSTSGDIYATPGVYPAPIIAGPAMPATIAFVGSRAVVNEDAGTVDIIVSILNAGDSATSVELELLSFATATEGSDFTYASTQLFSFVANPTVLQDTISIAISDDAVAENAEYFTLRLVNGVNADVNMSASEFTVMILDNDAVAPAAAHDIMLNYVGSYEHVPGSGSTAEIVAYDSASQRLFITNYEFNRVDMVDFSDPTAPDSLGSIDLSSYGSLTSIAVKNGLLAVSAANTVETDSGRVIFMNTSGTVLSTVKAGALPDMITFNHAGTKVLTANEGQPNGPYTIDPEGSISIIDISGGAASVTQANVTHARFNHYNGQEAALRAAGVRITGPSGTSAAADMEPEYITISDNDAYAYVTCQENNAIAVVNIANDSVINLMPLGYKDYTLSQNALDANDQFSNIEMANWPIRGLYMPDAIGHYSVGGVDYLVTANEGDAREYDTYEDVVRMSSSSYPLDSATFPFGNLLKQNIGRLNVFNTDGDTDNDGDFDEIYSLGSRSFSIWNASTGALVYDSGKDFEAITAADPIFGALFNASNSNNNFKNRSDDKGPEPEGVMITEINGQTFAFIGLERTGGVMVYNVTNPVAPRFVDYKNSRSTTGFGGDNGPEGIIYIAPNQSPNGKGYVVVANEVSGTLSFYEVVSNTVQAFTLGATDSITTYGGVEIFEGGFSGLARIPGKTDEFMVIGDRGPNAEADNHPNAGGAVVKFFPTPNYAPKMHHIKLEGDSIVILATQTVKRPGGTDATGLPNPLGFGGTGEVAWSDTAGTVIPSDLWGIDSEGIIEGTDNDYWLADEYGASVWHINKATGEVINRYWPFAAQPNNLPIDTVFANRKANRGFEGVAMTPNGKVYACIQSGMENPNVATSNATRLLRILEIDPSTGNTRMFGYELEPGIGGSTGIRNRDWKLGDLVAVNNNEFLVLEHAERGGYNSKKVFKFDISNATPITSDDFGGLTFEGLIDAAGAQSQGIQVVQKTEYLDLLANGWDLSLDKPEGLTIINDSTIAVVNDNDFGINSPNADGEIVASGKQTKLYVYTQPSALRTPLNYCEPIRLDVVGNTEFCAGDSAELTAVSGEGYTWYNGSTDLAISAASFVANAAGDYYAMSTVAGCEARSKTVSISVNAAPIATLSADQTVCEGTSVNITSGGYNVAAIASYAWSSGETTANISTSIAGDYTLVITDTNGCANTVLDTMTLMVNALPVVDLGADTALCTGESYALNGPAAMNSYLWNVGVINPFINVSAAGTYSLSVQDANGCTNADTIVVSVNALPMVNLGADTALCSGNSLTLSAPTSMSSYTWSDNSTSSILSVSASGNYAVTVVDANGCQGQDFINVVVNALPVFIVENDTVCANENAVLQGPTGLYAFDWSTGAQTQTLNVSAAGTYTLTVTNAFGCESSASAEVVVNALPTVAISGNTPLCMGDTAMLDAGTFVAYAWSNNQTSQTVYAMMNGTYAVTVTDANGCENTDAVVVVINNLPNVFAGFDATVCEGESVTLNAIGAPTFVWSNGTANGSSFNPTATATYYVTGTDANGCENQDSLEIVVNELPTTDLGEDQAICNGQVITIDAGAGFAAYSWNTGATTQTVDVDTSMAGTITVTVTDANGCEGSASVVVLSYVCVGIETTDVISFSMYPNPTRDFVTLTFDNANEVAQIEVLDATGRLVNSQRVSSNMITMDLGFLNSGIYFVRTLNSDSNILSTERLVISQ